MEVRSYFKYDYYNPNSPSYIQSEEDEDTLLAEGQRLEGETVVSLKCQLKMDEDNLLKLNIGRKFRLQKQLFGKFAP